MRHPRPHLRSISRHAATLRDGSDRIVSTSFGGTMCWTPRRPWRLSATRDGNEITLPCGFCSGCLEFQRRRLADRLVKKYNADKKPLWIFTISIELVMSSALSRALHRTPGLSLEPGFWRIAFDRMAVIASSTAALAANLRRRGLKYSIHKVLFRRGRRAWRVITQGIAHSREYWGANLNRWYARCLPRLEKLHWEIKSSARGRGYDRRTSPRLWTASGLTLVPPEAWKSEPLHQLGPRRLRAYLNRPGAAWSLPVGEVKAKTAQGLPLSPPLLLEEVGYRTSVHSDIPVPPDIQALIDRVAALARARGRGG